MLNTLQAAPLDSLNTALELATQEENLQKLAQANLNLGTYYLDQHNPEKALSFLLSALEGAGASYDLNQIQSCNQLLADCYEKLGNYPKANSFLIAYERLKKRKLADKKPIIFKQDKIQAQDQEINALKIENDLLIKSKENTKLRSILLLGFSLLFILIAYLFYQRKQLKRAYSLQLLQKDTYITEQHQQIKAQIEAL